MASRAFPIVDLPSAGFFEIGQDENRHFVAAGVDRKHWSSAAPIRQVFRNAFQHAGLQYFNPHSFRKTLARFGQQLARTPEEVKAWSQNLGTSRS